jgi:hypothetical protein
LIDPVLNLGTEHALKILRQPLQVATIHAGDEAVMREPVGEKIVCEAEFMAQIVKNK